MKKIVFALIFLGWLGAQSQPSIVKDEGNWDIWLYLCKEIRTETSHIEKRINFTLVHDQHKSTVYYREEERVLGSKEPEVKQVALENTIDLSVQEADSLFAKFLKAGILELPKPLQSQTKRDESYWSEDLVFSSGEDKIKRWYRYPPSETTRIEIHNIISSFIENNDLNIPDEPLKIRLSVREEPRWELLDLELNEPLWNPVFYHEKTIEDVEVHELGEGKKQAIIRISDAHGQIVKIWNATIQESKQKLEAYEGKTINYIWANTEVTVTEGDFETAKEVALQDVLKEPDKFHGKRIRMKGFYDFQWEIMGFHDRKGNNVWIGDWSSFFDRKNQKIMAPNPVEGLFLGRHRGYVTVEGIFLKGPAGHGGFWPGEIVRITRFDTHFKIDYIFWLCLLAIVLITWYCIKTIRRKTMPLKISNKTEGTLENGAN